MDFKFAGRSNNYGNCKSWFMYGGIIIFFGIMVFFDWIMIHSKRNIDNFLHKSLNNYDYIIVNMEWLFKDINLLVYLNSSFVSNIQIGEAACALHNKICRVELI